MTNNEKLFRQKVEKLAKVYVAKNKDYGDSFSQSLEKYGIIASLVRMGDKMNRIDSLYDKPTTEVDESLVDSLEDLANYAIMTAIWLEKQVEDMRNHVGYWDDDDFEDDFDEHEFDDLFDDESISHEEMKRELGLDDGWHEFDDDDDLFEDDIEQELDWNDGWHEFEDDESEDDPDDFSMDGLPKFRIVRRPKGGLSNEDYRKMIMDLYITEGDRIFDTDYLDMIRYLFGTEGD